MANDNPERPGLARADDGDRLQADLDRAFTDQLLAHSDRGGALARDFEASSSLMLPTLSDIDSRFVQKEQPIVQSRDEIESILSTGAMGDIAVEGMRLQDLLGRGGTSLQETAALKRGMIFLRKRMYAEAAEWWLLNRPKETLSDPRFYCVCTLLLAFTYQLAGQTSKAEAAAQEAMRVYKMI